MFAPVGYRSVAQLWREYVSARIGAIYHAASRHYADERFDPVPLIGSPLDIAEHWFAGILRSRTIVAATPDSVVTKLDVAAREDEIDVFAAVPPYRSLTYEAAFRVERGEADPELIRIAGPLFAAWGGDQSDAQAWRDAYPVIGNGTGPLSDEDLGRLCFHRLPVLFERDTYLIPDVPPYWTRFLDDSLKVERLCTWFGGRAICVPEEELADWKEVLTGRGEEQYPLTSRGGRPSKAGMVAECYLTLYPEGHGDTALKVVRREIEQRLERQVSESTLRRAIELARSLAGCA